MIKRIRHWLDKCREGEGMLVYWCTVHNAEWRYDKYDRCDKLRLSGQQGAE